MNRFTRAVALVNAALLAAGCASEPAIVNGPDFEEAQRASAAREAFDALLRTEERYGVFAGGQRIGYMVRERSSRNGQLVTVSRIVNDATGGRPDLDAGTTLTEIFAVDAPHDAVLLQRTDDDGGEGTRSIRLTAEGYVGEFSVNGSLIVEPLFDFQYRLADALAPQVWLSAGAAMSQCLSYPGYSLRRFSRSFNTECVSRLMAYPIDGVEVDAIETRRRDRTTVVRERASGRELYNQAGALGVELRLEPAAIATWQTAPARPAPEHLAQQTAAQQATAAPVLARPASPPGRSAARQETFTPATRPVLARPIRPRSQKAARQAIFKPPLGPIVAPASRQWQTSADLVWLDQHEGN